jgi:hypothetical protein
MAGIVAAHYEWAAALLAGGRLLLLLLLLHGRWDHVVDLGH